MAREPESRHVLNCKLLSQWASGSAILIGALDLVGWALNIPVLTSIIPGLATMKPFTAICFILSGISLWLVRLRIGVEYPDSRNLKISVVTSTVVSAVGLFSLIEYFYDLAPTFDESIFHNAVMRTLLQHPGRMSPATAFGFMVLGASLLWLGKSNFSPRIPQVLGLIGFFNGFISLVGYVYGIRALYLIPAYQTMAVNTTCLFVALGLGVTCARPQAGLMKPLTSNRMGGTLIRTLLPVLLVSTVVTGWVRLWGEKQGFYRTEFGTTLRTVFEVATFIVVLWVAAHLLNQADAKRQEREGLIRGILESVTDGVAIFDKDWHYRFVNEEFVHRIGMTQDQLIGKNAWEVFPEFVGTDPYRQLQRAMKERVVVEHESYLPRVPGWFSSRVFPTADGGLVTFSRNITEQREAEERLRESEEKFRTLADFIPQMVWMCTPDGLNIYFNQRWVEYTGMSLDESYGRGWNTPFHDDDKQKAWDAWNKAVAMGGAYQVESRLRAADGTYRWFLMQGTPLRDSGGEVVKWFGTCTDIEDMKQSEAALRESEQRFSNAFHTSPAAITITRIADGKFVDVNPAFLDLFGFSREEVVGHTSVELNMLTAASRRDLIRAQLESGGLRHEELLTHTKSGRPIQLLFSSQPMSLAGRPHHVTTLIDITDRKQAEQALRESEDRFRTLADFVPQMVWMCTPDGLNVYFNQRWVDYTGMSLEESYGRGWNTPFHDDDKQTAWDAWNKAVVTGGTYQVESRLRAADGNYRWFLMQGTPLRDATGEIVKWFGTCTDIEDIKKAEEALRRSEQEFRTMANAMPQLSWMANPDGFHTQST